MTFKLFLKERRKLVSRILYLFLIIIFFYLGDLKFKTKRLNIWFTVQSLIDEAASDEEDDEDDEEDVDDEDDEDEDDDDDSDSDEDEDEMEIDISNSKAQPQIKGINKQIEQLKNSLKKPNQQSPNSPSKLNQAQPARKSDSAVPKTPENQPIKQKLPSSAGHTPMKFYSKGGVMCQDIKMGTGAPAKPGRMVISLILWFHHDFMYWKVDFDFTVIAGHSLLLWTTEIQQQEV